MAQLSQRALRSIHRLLPDLYVPRTEQDFLTYAVATLPRLVAADISVFDEFKGDAVPRQLVWPRDVERFHSQSRELLEQFLHEHPIVIHINATGGTSPVKISDFITRRQLHKLGLYSELWRYFPVESEIAFSLNSGRRHIVGVALTRSSSDFDEDERATLTMVQPHFARAWRNAKTFTRVLDRSATLEHVVEDSALAVIVARRDGRIEWLTRSAADVMRRHFGNAGRRLPYAMRRLPLRGVDEYELSLGGARLTVREVPFGARRLLTIEEQIVRLERAALRPFGLTGREAEILDWVAIGKTNAEIATILSSKPLTVKKHLEHIYAKLRVTSRTAAAALVLRRIHGKPTASDS